MIFNKLYLYELLLILIIKYFHDDKWNIMLIFSWFSSYILIANKHELFIYLPQDIWKICFPAKGYKETYH